MVISTIGDLRSQIAAMSESLAERSVGFVPTMGYLHAGHAALVRRAREECDVVVVSIFVNPLQFGPNEDFSTYPRDFDRDMAILHAEGVDVIFAPQPEELYPAGADTFVVPGAVAEPLEGARRPGHFRGVATVVTKLFNAVAPSRAYFGEKDWQQLQVVRQMVRDLNMPVQIVPIATIRESDGLAMSSRNVRLSKPERAAAVCLSRALKVAKAAYAKGERSVAAIEALMAETIAAEPAATLDYAVVVDCTTLQRRETADAQSRALIAVRIGNVRLIDNGSL